ncbi:MAG: hypothetical protein ACRD18_03365 [Terriglobia bacterium]
MEEIRKGMALAMPPGSRYLHSPAVATGGPPIAAAGDSKNGGSTFGHGRNRALPPS